MFKNNNITSKYIRWMALNSFSNSMSSVIATTSMLNSIMIKPSYSDVIATTYIGKDIIGQFGGMLYSLKSGKKADKDPEKYIKKGVILQQISYFLENSSVLIKNSDYVLPFLGLVNMFQNISFVSIGAVNANNIQKISKENIGEIYCKVASINTLASTLGMISGLIIINVIPSYTVRSISILPILSCINYYTIVKATNIVKK